MKKISFISIYILMVSMLLGGCATKQNSEISLVLADASITVNGKEISTSESDAVYAGADIIYYEDGKDELYGEGDKEDAHSNEEADKHTVITITKPGTYRVSGNISYGQIVVDLGEDAEDNEAAVVNLILDNVNINCDVAPGILVLNAYECGDDSKKNASQTVNTTAAGFNLILAKDSENIVNGSYVAKIYKDGTTKEDIENDDAKKKYKFDAAIDSLVSFNINAEENGKLIVNADNEGISSSLHLTINSGEIIINSHDDAINTSEDNVSVLTINGGIVTCDAGFGDEGDGIDSNGYITMNGGYVIACANGRSMDSGIDSDKGIYINGGTLLASGNMYDEISSDSTQSFMVFGFNEKVTEDELVMVTDEEDNPIIAFSAVNDYTIAAYSAPDLTEGTYHLYKVASVTGDLNGNIYINITDYQDAVQLTYTSNFMGGFGGMMPGEMEKPFEGEMPKGGRGDRGPAMGAREDMKPATEFVLSKEYYQFGGISVATDYE